MGNYVEMSSVNSNKLRLVTDMHEDFGPDLHLMPKDIMSVEFCSNEADLITAREYAQLFAIALSHDNLET